MNESECPSRDRISHYAAGRLPAAEAEGLEEHLSNCEACSDVFNRAADQPDPLLSQLKTPVPAEQSGYLNEPEFRNAVSSSSQLDVSAIFAEVVGRGRAREQARWDSNLIGRRLGQYELEEVIGQGGMGMVYRARHAKLDRQVAFKVLPDTGPSQAQLLQRFEREIQAVGRLQHPNIVQAFDADEVEGIHYLAMEFVDGTNLSDLLKRHGELPVAEACELIRQAAIGLQHAYEHGLVHRDIKPANLMLDRSGTVKVLDLGLALLQNNPLVGQGELTSTGQLMGTVDYMAPEQAENTHEVDIRADIYGLGATLYALLTGAAPFAGPEYSSALKKIAALANDSPKPIRERRSDLPKELATVVDRMLHRDLSQRYSTPAEVADALKPFASNADLVTLLSSSANEPRSSPPPSSGDTAPQDASESGTTEAADAVTLPSSTPASDQQIASGAKSSAALWKRSRIPLVSLIAASLAAIAFLFASNSGTDVDSDDNSKFVSASGVDPTTTPETHPFDNSGLDSVAPPEATVQLGPAGHDTTKVESSTGTVEEKTEATSYDGLQAFLDKGARVLVKLVNSGKQYNIYGPGKLPKEAFEVLEIQLEELPISDAELLALGHLPKLHLIAFQNRENDLNSESLWQIAKYSQLRYLKLNSVGSFSDDSLRELGDLRKLTGLSLFPQGGQVTGEWLDGFDEDHPLEEFIVSAHLLPSESAVERLSRLANLKKLTLTGSSRSLTHLTHLTSLKKLKTLQIRAAVSVDGLRQLGGALPVLTSLTLDISGSDQPSLPVFDALQNFKNLEGLHIVINEASDEALLLLQELSQLKSLRIDGGNFTTAGIVSLKEKLPGCEFVVP